MNHAHGHAVIYLKGEVAARMVRLGGGRWRVNMACSVEYLFSVY